MPGTSSFSFKDYRRERISKDVKSQEACLSEAARCLFIGEAINAKFHLTDYIHATIGMKQLASSINTNEKKLSVLLSPGGNPSLNELSTILLQLQKSNKIHIDTNLSVSSTAPKRSNKRLKSA